MTNALVSSIIIFLDEERFLEEAIQSVFAQTYENWELLLVDDGSTDRSSEIARSYAKQYPDKVRYLEHEGHQNRGMSAARNLGVHHARGQYIAFLDADDVWLPQKLKQQVKILESQPEAVMLYGRTQFWHSWTGNLEDEQYDRLTNLGVPFNTLIQPPALLKLFLEQEDTVASTCSVLIRREVFQTVGGFEDEFRSMYEDMVFYTKVFLQAPVFVASGCWDRYRQHPDNSCSVARRTGLLDLPSKPSSARGKFLAWVEKYLAEQGAQTTEVWAILQQQLWPYRHSTAYQTLELLKQTKRSVGGVVKQVVKGLTPAPIWQWLGFQRHKRRFHRQRHQYLSGVGWVNFGDLRRLTPINDNFGFDRGKPIDRYYTEQFLARQVDDIQGRVLEIGNNTYTRQFGGTRVSKSDVMHVLENNPQTTIIGDLTCADHIPSNSFDCIIATQALPFIYDVQSAVRTLHRILKPGGVLLVTTAGISQVNPTDMELWGDYWRFTKRSARLLFETIFPSDQITVEAHGNVFTTMAFLHGMSLSEVQQQELDQHDPDYEMLITIRAVKLEAI